MSLDLDRLEKPRIWGGNLIARCPACAEVGADRSCEHLFIADEGRGRFGCVIYPHPTGNEHRRRIWELVGQRDASLQGVLATPNAQKEKMRGKPRLPVLRPLNVEEMATVAAVRGWHSFGGLELLTQRGLLWHGNVFDDDREWPAWIITDSTRRNAQARRLDGKLWHGIHDKKAKTLPGSDPSWPIGAAEIGERPFVALCEGQPDFCAALFVAWWEGLEIAKVAPVCLTGAGNSIHTDAFPYFAGKVVRITVHDDPEGRDAARRWADQLYRAGATHVDGFDFAGILTRDGQLVQDLADFATLLDPDESVSVRVFDDLPAPG